MNWPQCLPSACALMLHSGFKWLIPAQNKFSWCDFTSISKQISANLDLFPFSGMSFMLKICQTVVGISITIQFDEFFESRFWRVFDVWPNCLPAARTHQCAAPHYEKKATFFFLLLAKYVVRQLNRRLTLQLKLLIRSFLAKLIHSATCAIWL